MNGLNNVLERYMREKGDWVTKGKLTAIIWFHKDGRKQYLPETVGRQLRELETQKILAVKEDGKSVQYKYIPEEWRQYYLHPEERTSEKMFNV